MIVASIIAGIVVTFMVWNFIQFGIYVVKYILKNSDKHGRKRTNA